MRCIQYLALGVKIPAHAQSHYPCPLPLHSPQIPHPKFSHYAPHCLFLLWANTECAAFGIWLWGSKSPPTPNLAIPVLYHCIHVTYPTLVAPTMHPFLPQANTKCAAFGIWLWGFKIPVCAWSPHSHSQPPHLPHLLHLTHSYCTPCHRFPLQASTKCGTFGSRLWGSKTPPTPDLAIPTLHHDIHPVYTTLNTPTMLPTIYFHQRPVPDAVHSVLDFGGHKPRPRLILSSPILHHSIHPVYTTLNKPTMPPAICFCHRSVPNAAHLVFNFWG